MVFWSGNIVGFLLWGYTNDRHVFIVSRVYLIAKSLWMFGSSTYDITLTIFVSASVKVKVFNKNHTCWEYFCIGFDVARLVKIDYQSKAGPNPIVYLNNLIRRLNSEMPPSGTNVWILF